MLQVWYIIQEKPNAIFAIDQGVNPDACEGN